MRRRKSQRKPKLSDKALVAKALRRFTPTPSERQALLRISEEKNAKIKARCLERIAKEIEDPEKQTEAWSRAVERAEKYGRKGTLPAPNGRMLWSVIQQVKYPVDPDELAAGSLQAELREKELAGYGSELDAAKWSIQQAKNRLQWVKQHGLNKCGEIEKLEVEAFTSETTAKLSEIQESIDTFLAERLARKDFSEGHPGEEED